MKAKKVTTKKKIAVKKTVVKKSLPVENKKYPRVNVSLILPNAKFGSAGESVTECLNQIRPGLIKSKGTFLIEVGAKKSTITMKPFEIRQLLLKKITQEIFEKRMLSILK